jgi:hypothetical protein
VVADAVSAAKSLRGALASCEVSVLSAASACRETVPERARRRYRPCTSVTRALRPPPPVEKEEEEEEEEGSGSVSMTRKGRTKRP